MKKFMVNINYSWGDEEEPVVLKTESEYDAFMQMIDLATKEAKVSMELDTDLTEINPTNILIYPSDKKIILLLTFLVFCGIIYTSWPQHGH